MPHKESVKNYILTELISDGSAVELNDTTQLIDLGIIDSLGIMSLLSFLESNFSLQITGDDLIPDNFASIEKISELISQKSGLR